VSALSSVNSATEFYLYALEIRPFVLRRGPRSVLPGRVLFRMCGFRDSLIYSVGGSVGGKEALDFSDCEKYVVGSEGWEVIPSLNCKKSSVGICAVAQRFAYVFGGRNLKMYSIPQIEKIDSCDERSGWINVMLKGTWQGISEANCIQISAKEILIFRGNSSYIYDIHEQIIKEQEGLLGYASFYKHYQPPVIFNNNVYCIDIEFWNIQEFSIENRKWNIISKDIWMKNAKEIEIQSIDI
jgi:hypothetical protein